jgi:S-adenosylmethionine-diacylglycerol 3-amino-3-carboxypropyl transferase
MQFLPKRVKFNQDLIRYSQCWEDTDLVLNNLAVSEGDTILSIASAGDNTLSLLTANPSKIIAIDFCQAQLALVALKIAAFKVLSYEEVLTFLGIGKPKSSTARLATYELLRPELATQYRQFFDKRPELIVNGIIASGKLERYFAIFRQFILPLAHSRKTVNALFENRTRIERQEFFERQWNTVWYQLAFKLFFGKTTMALIGREASFFKEASGSLSNFLARASQAALTDGTPSSNHYLHYILTGNYGSVLPHYLRRENFEAIRSNLDKVVLVEGSLQKVLEQLPSDSIDAFNLSDVFEYMTEDNCEILSHSINRVAKRGGRLAYWNMAVDRFANQYDSNLFATRRFGQNQNCQIQGDQSLAAASTTFFYRRFCLDVAIEGAR